MNMNGEKRWGTSQKRELRRATIDLSDEMIGQSKEPEQVFFSSLCTIKKEERKDRKGKEYKEETEMERETLK